MIQMVRVINIIIIFFFYTCAHAQYYDVGYNTNYFNISNLDSSKYRIIKTVFNVDPSKETKRVFNANGELMEELVFVNSVLVSGIEYFTHPYFSFLSIPRHFKIEEVKHKFSDYENINTSSSLVKYMIRDTLSESINVRMYNNQIQDFYILDGPQGYNLYFK
mgnify:CR=1 FL=1